MNFDPNAIKWYNPRKVLPQKHRDKFNGQEYPYSDPLFLLYWDDSKTPYPDRATYGEYPPKLHEYFVVLGGYRWDSTYEPKPEETILQHWTLAHGRASTHCLCGWAYALPKYRLRTEHKDPKAVYEFYENWEPSEYL